MANYSDVLQQVRELSTCWRTDPNASVRAMDTQWKCARSQSSAVREYSVSLTVRAFMVILIVMSMSEQLSLAEAKAHLSEVVEGVETEHRRVVITKHGRPSVVVLAVADLEALEETLDVLSDPEAMADLREAEAARRSGASVELTKDEALARWSRG